MKLTVWNEGIWKPSRFSNSEVRRVSFKSLDKNDKKTYYLNLDNANKGYEQWLPYLINGTVLDVQVMPMNGKNIINKFQPFLVVKQIKEKE